MAVGMDSVAFFLKTKPKEENDFFISPYNVAYFDLVLYPMFKTKRPMLTDRQNDRLTDKMTTTTL